MSILTESIVFIDSNKDLYYIIKIQCCYSYQLINSFLVFLQTCCHQLVNVPEDKQSQILLTIMKQSSQKNCRCPEEQQPLSRRDFSDRRTGYQSHSTYEDGGSRIRNGYSDSKSSNGPENSYKNSRGSGHTARGSGASWWFGDKDDYADDIIVYRFYNGGNGETFGDVGSTQNGRGYQEQYGSSRKEFHRRRIGSGSTSRGDSKYGSRSDTTGGSDYPSQRRSSGWLFGERDDYADEILVYRFYNGGRSSSNEEDDSIPSRRRDQVQKGSSGGDFNIGRDSKIQYQGERHFNSNQGSGSDYKTSGGSSNYGNGGSGSSFESQGGGQDRTSTRGNSDSTVQYTRGKPVGSGNYGSDSNYETNRESNYTARSEGSTWWFGERDDYVDEILVYRFYNGGNIPRVGKVEDISIRRGHHDKQESSGGESYKERPVGENTKGGQDSNHQYSGIRPVINRKFESGGEYETRRGSDNYGSRSSSFESQGGEEYYYKGGSDSTIQYQKGRPVSNPNYESESNYGSGGGSDFPPPPRKGSSWWFDERDDYADDIMVYRFYSGRNGGNVDDVGSIQKRRGYREQQESSGGQYHGEKSLGDNTSGGRGSTNQYQGGRPLGSGNYKSRSSTLDSQETGPIGNRYSGSRDCTNTYKGEKPVGRDNYRGGNGYETSGRSGYPPRRTGSRWWFGERDDYVDEILVYRFYNGGNISSRISTLESLGGRMIIGSSSSIRTETRENRDSKASNSKEEEETELTEYESSDMSDRLESMGDENGGYTVNETGESKLRSKVRTFRYYTKFLEVENEDDLEEVPGPTVTKYTSTGRTKRTDKNLIGEIKRKLPRTADYTVKVTVVIKEDRRKERNVSVTIQRYTLLDLASHSEWLGEKF